MKDQEVRAVIRIIGSLLVALSGLILFSDKVTTFQFENNFGFKSTKTFIWVLSQSLSPMLLIIATLFKPYKTAYLIPFYFYFIQLFWIFNPNLRFDNTLLQAYAIGCTIFFVFLIYTFNTMKILRDKSKNDNQKVLLEAKEILSQIKVKIND